MQERYLFSREIEDAGFFKIHIGSRTSHTYVHIVFHVAAAKEKFARKKSRWKRKRKRDKRASPMTRRQFLFRRKQTGEQVLQFQKASGNLKAIFYKKRMPIEFPRL